MDFPIGGYGRTVRSAPVGKLEKLQILMDTSAVEVFANDGEAVMSARWAEQSLCDAVACALMSAHKAAQCIAEAARAVASQHLAQQSQRATFLQFEFRYQ